MEWTDRCRPLRSESSLCNAPRRIVGGEPLCLANALVPITKVKTGSNHPVEIRTGKDLVRDRLDLLPCSGQLGLDLAAKDILQRTSSFCEKF